MTRILNKGSRDAEHSWLFSFSFAGHVERGFPHALGEPTCSVLVVILAGEDLCNMNRTDHYPPLLLCALGSPAGTSLSLALSLSLYLFLFLPKTIPRHSTLRPTLPPYKPKAERTQSSAGLRHRVPSFPELLWPAHDEKLLDGLPLGCPATKAEKGCPFLLKGVYKGT